MFERDEFEHLGAVAVRLEQQRAQAVGDHLGLLAEVDAMLQHRPQQAGAAQLRAQLLVAARRAQDDLRAGDDALVDRMIGRGIAGMQRDHDVDRADRMADHIALLEAQPPTPCRCALRVAQLDQIGAQLDPDHLGATPSVSLRWAATAKLR